MLPHWLRQPVASEDIIQEIATVYIFQHQVYTRIALALIYQHIPKQEKKTLTEIATSRVRNEYLAEATDIWVVEFLQNTDLFREAREMGTVFPVIAAVIRHAELLCVDDLDGPPFACRARHRLHHRRECAATDLVSHVVESVDTRQVHRGEVAIDKPIVLRRALLLLGRAECDLITISKDSRSASVYAHPIDLWMRA